MIDIAILAKETVTFLAPFLPYLVKASEGAAEEVGKQLGEKVGGGAWEKAEALWVKLRPRMEATEATRDAIQEVAAAPGDEDARAVLRVQLKKLLAEDESLAREVSEMQREMRHAGVSVAAIGDRSVAIGGKVSGSNIVTGDQNKIRDDGDS
jgi:thioredoxin-like negative regulator of GroEL